MSICVYVRKNHVLALSCRKEIFSKTPYSTKQSTLSMLMKDWMGKRKFPFTGSKLSVKTDRSNVMVSDETLFCRFFMYVFLAAIAVLLLVGAQQLLSSFGVSIPIRQRSSEFSHDTFQKHRHLPSFVVKFSPLFYRKSAFLSQDNPLRWALKTKVISTMTGSQKAQSVSIPSLGRSLVSDSVALGPNPHWTRREHANLCPMHTFTTAGCICVCASNVDSDWICFIVSSWMESAEHESLRVTFMLWKPPR